MSREKRALAIVRQHLPEQLRHHLDGQNSTHFHTAHDGIRAAWILDRDGDKAIVIPLAKNQFIAWPNDAARESYEALAEAFADLKLPNADDFPS